VAVWLWHESHVVHTFDLRLLDFLQQLLKGALLLFEHVAIRTIVGLVDLVRQPREVSLQDFDEQGSIVVAEGQGVHVSSPIGVPKKAAAAATLSKPIIAR
jgi:hypothetical protein